MAFRKYAKALVSRSNVPFDDWMETIRDQHEGAVPKDQVHRIAKTVLRKCDPKQYLLSHATIVASVDTYAPKSVKTGRFMHNGVQIDVRWPDFRVKPDCDDLINNNKDFWSRPLLLSTYRSFIGAENFQEHIQLKELSKGFIVDAIARDIGRSVYIDILVATDRKHQKLVSDILSGAVSGLSMGCVSIFTTCSKCGNVASDDSQLCPCILYEGKGAKFIDEDGQQHQIAEQVGHISIQNSCQFIEASWVMNPAFSGAVRRNFLNADSPLVAAAMDISHRLNESRRNAPVVDGVKKAASLKIAQDEEAPSEEETEDLPSEDLDSSDNNEPEEVEEKKSVTDSTIDKINKFVDHAEDRILELLLQSLEKKLAPKADEVGIVNSPPDLMAYNDSLVRSSQSFAKNVKKVFAAEPRIAAWAVHSLKNFGKLSAADKIKLSWICDRVYGVEKHSSLYKAAMASGPRSNYPSDVSYLASCRSKLGRAMTEYEKVFLLRKGKIASISGSEEPKPILRP